MCKRRASVTVDHVTNKARGGTDEDANLQGLCGTCHTEKTLREAGEARFIAKNTRRRRR